MSKQIWKGRGRPLKSMHSYKDARVLENLAGIAILHKVDANEFFNRIVEAWNHEDSECEQVNIECRKRTKNSAISSSPRIDRLWLNFRYRSTSCKERISLKAIPKPFWPKIPQSRIPKVKTLR